MVEPRRRWLTALRMTVAMALAVIGAAGTGVRGSEVSAAVDCVSAYGSLFDGYVGSATPNPTYEGASAVMIHNPAVECDTGLRNGNNFVYTWVMIHQNNSAPGGSGAGYAQMGFFSSYGTCNYFTSEYDRDVNDTFHRHIHTEYGCLANNQNNHFWVQYLNDSLHMNVDVTPMDITPWSPYHYWPLTNGKWSTQFFSETKYLGSSVPTSNFGSMQVQNYDDTWTSTLPSDISPGCPWPARYILGSLSNDFFAIQTYGNSHAYNC